MHLGYRTEYFRYSTCIMLNYGLIKKIKCNSRLRDGFFENVFRVIKPIGIAYILK